MFTRQFSTAKELLPPHTEGPTSPVTLRIGEELVKGSSVENGSSFLPHPRGGRGRTLARVTVGKLCKYCLSTLTLTLSLHQGEGTEQLESSIFYLLRRPIGVLGGLFVATLLVFGLPLYVSAQAASGKEAKETVKPIRYADYFTDQALGLGLIHTGNRAENIISLKDFWVEPVWPGNPTQLTAFANFGTYRVQVFSPVTGALLFSQGYCTLFGEWQATAESVNAPLMSMEEPLRIPFPKKVVQVKIQGRNKTTGGFETLFKVEINPAEYTLNSNPQISSEQSALQSLVLQGDTRSPHNTLDIVILPDGYTIADEAKMIADARRFAAVLLDASPFNRHKDKISIRLVKGFSEQAGCDEPRKSIFKNTLLGASFDTFGAPRYLTVEDMRTVRQVAQIVPYDSVMIMVNSSRYGGGGIYNWFSIFTSDSEYSEYVMLHEFAHSFAGLGDEYYSPGTGLDEFAFYPKGIEPWEPNITRQTERSTIKWGHLIAPETPIPTPDTDEYKHVVGLFEGAGYTETGLYRPTADSKMHHKGQVPFGPVNEAAIEKMIRHYTQTEAQQGDGRQSHE